MQRSVFPLPSASASSSSSSSVFLGRHRRAKRLWLSGLRLALAGGHRLGHQLALGGGLG